MVVFAYLYRRLREVSEKAHFFAQLPLFGEFFGKN
jgi:hypothetical protein